MLVTGRLKWRRQEMRRAEVIPPVLIFPTARSKGVEEMSDAELDVFSRGGPRPVVPIEYIEQSDFRVTLMPPRAPAWCLVRRRGHV